MGVYGYVRISTPKQSIDRQIRNIKQEFPEALIIQETSKMGREKWNKLFSSAMAGDTIIFDSCFQNVQECKGRICRI